MRRAFEWDCEVLGGKFYRSTSIGQLGSGTTTDSSSPVSVTGISTAVSVSVGDSHGCVVLSDGTAKCWGWNSQGQLGNNATTNSTSPVTVTGVSGAVSIIAGRDHSCAALSDGTVKCWGDNLYGEIGDGTTTDRLTAVAVTGLSGVVSIDAGYSHSCALLSDGTAKCWGLNQSGGLGNGTTTDSSTPVVVTGLSTAISIAAGTGHSCATLSDGTAKCWGRDDFGQIGNGASGPSTTPVTVTGLTDSVSIVAGEMQSCAALSDGTVKCWGANDYAQLGTGTTTNSSSPVSVTGFADDGSFPTFQDAVMIATGDAHSCALLTHGIVKCWGSSYANGTTTASSTPITVSGLSSVAALTSGTGFSCATLSNGTAKCWGTNSNGQLGDGTTTNSATPVTVSGLSGVVSIDAGTASSCALLSDGTMKCWGGNSIGQLGDGTTTQRTTPVSVTGLSSVASISVGHQTSCAVLSYGTAKCWGYNSEGQLGDGTTASRSTPVTVSGLSGAVAITTNGGFWYGFSCALLSNGTAKCWGDNTGNGQLGDGTTLDRWTPVAVVGLSGAIAISNSSSSACALLSNGTAKCWGSNGYGQLGDGTTTSSDTPVTVSGLGGAISIQTSGYVLNHSHSCATLSDGTARCWGSNEAGQLGTGTGANSTVPGPISLIEKIYVRADATAENAGGTTSLLITKPTGTAIDDTMVAGITTRPSTTTITPPSGWTLAESQATGNVTQSVYYRVATAADVSATDYTWTLSTTAKASGVIVAYGNVDPAAPVITSDGLATGTSTTITAPSLTTSETDFQSVVFNGIASDGAITGPAGYTLVDEIASSGGGTTKVRTYVTHKNITTSGATGAVTSTGPSIDNVGQHLLLKKAP